MERHASIPCSLQGINILFGVTGSIAVYKTAGWVHAMSKEEAVVNVIMTQSARRFVSSLTFEALSSGSVYTDMFGEGKGEAMAHISLSDECDVILLAPATAHTIARLANGLADDLLSTAILANTAPVILCPAMNSKMLNHPATQRNIEILKSFGYIIVDPDAGLLACGDEGAGRLPEWERVREVLLGMLSPKDLLGQSVLITAGPTREPLDPARYLSNRSSGKMGYALARTALRRGAEVILISGPVCLEPPSGVQLVTVATAREMLEAVRKYAPSCSVIVKAAAVADFKPVTASDQKIKKGTTGNSLQLSLNTDILAELGRTRKKGQVLVGFAAESTNHQAEGMRKLKEKNVDLMVVNDILGKDTGFDVDTNQVTLLTSEGVEQLELLTKEETAHSIWDRVISMLKP